MEAKYRNTNTQIHKYSLAQITDKPNMCHIYEKLMIQGPQKQCSQCLACKYTYTNTQVQVHKFTNTVWVKFAERPNMCYINEKLMVQGLRKQCCRVLKTIND